MRAYAYVCAHAQNAFQRGRRRVRVRVRVRVRAMATFMYSIICTRARMYTCMRALAECISACVGVGVGVGARARVRRERASTNCVSLRTLYIDVYLYMNVGMYGCIIARLYVCVCVDVHYMYIDIYIYIYLQRHIHIYIYMYVCICL